MPANDYASNVTSRQRNQNSYTFGSDNTRAVAVELRRRVENQPPEQQSALDQIEKLGPEAIHGFAVAGLTPLEYMQSHKITSLR